jgi:magnesium-transporting ATPase (P-type)
MDTGEVPMVKLGDASVAAPFTSKLPSIRSCVDVVRQGRCTLVSTIQMQQILALNCLIAAYSLSALFLDGVRSGEAQMIASGILLTVASLAFTYARPVQVRANTHTRMREASTPPGSGGVCVHRATGCVAESSRVESGAWW